MVRNIKWDKYYTSKTEQLRKEKSGLRQTSDGYGEATWFHSKTVNVKLIIRCGWEEIIIALKE